MGEISFLFVRLAARACRWRFWWLFATGSIDRLPVLETRDRWCGLYVDGVIVLWGCDQGLYLKKSWADTVRVDLAEPGCCPELVAGELIWFVSRMHPSRRIPYRASHLATMVLMVLAILGPGSWLVCTLVLSFL